MTHGRRDEGLHGNDSCLEEDFRIQMDYKDPDRDFRPFCFG